jgi:hypothetical protein
MAEIDAILEEIKALEILSGGLRARLGTIKAALTPPRPERRDNVVRLARLSIQFGAGRSSPSCSCSRSARLGGS